MRDFKNMIFGNEVMILHYGFIGSQRPFLKKNYLG